MAAVLCACGGSGSTGAGAVVGPDAGLPDAGSTDAGVGDGGVADDCTGIVPAVPASALAFEVGENTGEICSLSVTDGTGVILAESHSGTSLTSLSAVNWHEFDTRGIGGGFFSGGFSLAPQASGFLGTESSAGAVNVEAWSGQGKIQNLVPFSSSTAPVGVAPGFPDGVVMVQNSGSTLLVSSFDDLANAVKTASGAAPAGATVLAAAQDQTGPVLAVLSNGQGIWTDLAAGTSGAPFSLGSGTTAAARALIGGGVAVRLDGHWTAIVNPSNSILLPPRAWMVDGSDFTIARGGKAYAVTTGSNVIALAVGQTTCGTVTLPGVTSVSAGIEGTVVGSSGTNGCSKVFWPKLLQ
ncbi:MAG TPA: hypothetical protein VH083_07795 [Myxococcales bacterium]|nr:hypothetical protein [Myxococcales bacterium]